MRDSLTVIMNRYGSDKSRNDVGRQNYCKHYEYHLGHLRDNNIALLELGIGGEDTELGGASLLGWQEYFPHGSITGIDIYDKSALNTDRITTHICNQNDKTGLLKIITKPPDIIIDDASHISSLTIESFCILFPQLRPGGWYIIEDISCSYRWDFEGNTNLKDLNPSTTINYLMSMVHDINPVHFGDSSYQKKFTDVESIHFYPDIVFIKKKL